MREPRYTYSAEAPCFKITHDRPFVLQGCSCGWPSTGCLKFHAMNEQQRAASYSANVVYSGEPQSSGDKNA
jgi:hypothetical protein